MKKMGCRHWRQMEWIGFYFQFLCETHLPPLVKTPGPRYGNVVFDGFHKIPWDFKAHAINTSSHQVIVNDRVAIERGIRDYGAVGVILALGKVTYNDEKRTFQKWHSKLKGGKSEYERKRIRRGAWSRLRKVSFMTEQITFIRLTRAALKKAGSFQKGFRNADGSARRAKVLIDLEKIRPEIVHCVEFKKKTPTVVPQ